MRVLISGHLPKGAGESEKQKFQDAEANLRKAGHYPLNPAGKYSEIMIPLSVMIHQLESCEAIYLLAGWKQSREAMVLKYYCEVFGKVILFQSKKEKQEDEADMRVVQIKEAIRRVTGLKYEKYRKGKRGSNEIYFARMIFSKHCADLGMSAEQSTRYVSRDRTTLRRYQDKYVNEYEHNPRFRETARRISQILQVEREGVETN